MKNIDRKYLIMGGTIIGVIVVLLLSVLILSSCSSSTGYEKIEKKLVKAAEKYVAEKQQVEADTQLVITADQLSEAGYIKPLDELKNDGCTATVLAMNNGGVMNYLPNLTCTNYKTKTLKTAIVDDNLVAAEDGLYAINGEYVFRGKKVNNYLKFAGKMWRIIRIDTNGNIKLVGVDESEKYTVWDNKFNTETGYSTGENDYETSFILEYLNSQYEGYKESTKKHIIPVNVCIGGREKTNLVISTQIDCSVTLAKQYVGLINPTDYAQASLDDDCKQINDGSCTNFNYMYNTLGSTWTVNPIMDNTYQVILYLPGHFSATDANETNKYHLVINISGNELYKKGTGTLEDPYVVE